MKILVMSDSHGHGRNVGLVLKKHPDADAVIHLGDGAEDLRHFVRKYKNIRFYRVQGNCDWGSDLPVTCKIVTGNITIIITHGHAFAVKYSTDQLVDYAVSENADIVLYGHTHFQEHHSEKGIHVMNPGALIDGYYGIIDINGSSIDIECSEL